MGEESPRTPWFQRWLVGAGWFSVALAVGYGLYALFGLTMALGGFVVGQVEAFLEVDRDVRLGDHSHSLVGAVAVWAWTLTVLPFVLEAVARRGGFDMAAHLRARRARRDAVRAKVAAYREEAAARRDASAQ